MFKIVLNIGYKPINGSNLEASIKNHMVEDMAKDKMVHHKKVEGEVDVGI